MKHTFIALAILTLSGTAFAETCNGTAACSGNPTVGDNRNGQTVGVGQIANGGVSRSNSTSTSSATGGSSTSSATGGSSTATGGAGGSSTATGGAGGSVSGVVGGSSSSTGGSVSGVAGVNGGINTSINISDNGSTVSAAEAAARGNVEAARISGDAAVAAARELSDIKIRNTPSVNPAALTSSNDTCMGSTSGSVNAPGIGIGLGTTWVDDNCKMLKNSRELWNMGMRAASMAMMCTDGQVRDALEITGFKCPQTERDEKARAARSGAMNAGEPTDPYVRARMGLPPLK